MTETTDRAALTADGAAPVFHRKGAGYFWLFNDYCKWEDIDAQLQAFAAANDVMALSMHPRHGLQVPYGSDEWFELIERTCRRAKELGLKIWLYDEDPFPSGNAGGRLVMERPELVARGLQSFTYDPGAQGDIRLFTFPSGTLIWCGLVNEETGETVDLTGRVGVVRREWKVFERWDSRFFYPDTPLYTFPRCEANVPEYALTVPEIPAGMVLKAVVATRAAFSAWGPYSDFIDSLNPEATKLFLACTHERYQQTVGDLFGDTIEAIFTDEPKFFDPNPWTPGLFEEFQRDMGYDIRPHLHYLFTDHATPRAVITRLHYRYYVAERFLNAWLRPVGAWCREHNLKLVGHISPEDDMVEQAMCVGNLLPCMKEFDLPGIDIIIPALGDARHPLLSIGVTCATSIAQQQNKAGVMTETGHGCHSHSAAEVGKILLWQQMMGVTATILHCAFLSTRGPREYERPDFGPLDAKLWPGMHAERRKLAEVQTVTHNARQLAPVALVWPVRSFNTVRQESQADRTGGLRVAFTTLLADCLDRQVGTHVIDEDDLAALTVEDGVARLGRARYTHLLIPSCAVLKQETLDTLKALRALGITVQLAGTTPILAQTADTVVPADLSWCPPADLDALPRLAQIDGDATDIRCTAWEQGGTVTRLLMNLGTAPATVRVDGAAMVLEAGVVYTV